MPRLECPQCGFVANEESFKSVEMQSGITHSYDEVEVVKCPGCQQTEFGSVEYDDNEEVSFNRAVDILTERYLDDTENDILHNDRQNTEDMIRNGFKGYNERTIEELNENLAADDMVVLSNEEYEAKYGEMDT